MGGLRKPPNNKRGFVGDGCDGCMDANLLHRAGWYYSYHVSDHYHTAQPPNEAARFTPMNWCIKSFADEMPDYVNTTFFMGFNEPNNLHNCNTDARTVATAWATVMSRYPDSLLVSPATAGNGIHFFDEFFGNCTELYGASGCRISYIAVHAYSCTPSSTLSYLKSVYDRYGLPVWLTEFSCGEGSKQNPTEDHFAFMKEILPMLDQAPFVYRYAWMSARDGRSLRGLVENGPDGQQRLTMLGKLWNGHYDFSR